MVAGGAFAPQSPASLIRGERFYWGERVMDLSLLLGSVPNFILFENLFKPNAALVFTVLI
jgi:hypothetical protein